MDGKGRNVTEKYYLYREGCCFVIIRGVTVMELIDVITSKENRNRAYKKVVVNKGAGGVDGMKVEELGAYIKENKDEIVQSIKNRTYMPKPVRRFYIPKDNGKQRSCHDAIEQALEYLNEGYEWVIDIDIEQFFDKVNHDKLIQILREQVKDSTTLNLIRKYLKAININRDKVEVMEVDIWSLERYST